MIGERRTALQGARAIASLVAMWFIALLIGPGMDAVACAGATKEASSKDSKGPLAAEGIPENPMKGTAPSTIALHLSTELQEKIQQAAADGEKPPTIRLTVEGIAAPHDLDVGVRVFLDKPDATAKTPTTDPHYAGSFTFFGDPKTTRPQTVLLNLSPAFQKLRQADLFHADSTLRLTFVPAPLRETDDIGGAVIPFQKVILASHE